MVKPRNGTLHSGAVARAVGVSPDTIRHYERIGVLPKALRGSSGYRIYSASAVERVLIVQRALCIGFTLPELSDIFKTRDAGGVPCQRVYELARNKLAGLESDIAALKKTERYLRNVLADWKQRVQKADCGQKAHLLQSLTDAMKNSPGVSTKFRRRRKS
jgi:DNA-binding transcriptional MerR regulator